MSYEGYTEYLCEKGHYLARDVYADALASLCTCGARLAFVHEVDETNGEDEELPDTMPAPKEEIGFDDIPCADHYGNRFFTKRMRYRPISDWHELPQPPSSNGE